MVACQPTPLSMSIMNLYSVKSWSICTVLCVLGGNVEISLSSNIFWNTLYWVPGHGSEFERQCPTTESTELVTWCCPVISTGRVQMLSAGNVWDWCAALDQVLEALSWIGFYGCQCGIEILCSCTIQQFLKMLYRTHQTDNVLSAVTQYVWYIQIYHPDTAYDSWPPLENLKMGHLAIIWATSASGV